MIYEMLQQPVVLGSLPSPSFKIKIIIILNFLFFFLKCLIYLCQSDSLLEYFNINSTRDLIWLTVGIGAQLMFSMRFLVQWIASERARQSIVPVKFWWLSLAGASMLLVYGILDRDLVIILAQAFGFIVYARNLWFIYNSGGHSGQ